MADSGNVYEVPEGSAGLIAASQSTLKTGLGTNLKLAVDGSGNVYVADPDNHRVVKLANAGGTIGFYGQIETDLTGFNAPSAVAVDASGDVFVADGSNLYEVTPGGTQSTVLTTLSGVTGLAVDPSGAVYVTSGGLTERIPNVGGVLTAASQTAIASDDTGATSVALDLAGNVYLTNATAGNVDMVGASASFNFGTLGSTTGSASQAFTVLDFWQPAPERHRVCGDRRLQCNSDYMHRGCGSYRVYLLRDDHLQPRAG